MAQRDPAEGFRALLAAYGSRLFGYFYRATGDRHEAEDLLGEMMVRLVKQIGRYDERGRFEPWLFRIAANLVRDRARRHKAAPAFVKASAEDDGDPLDRAPAEAEAVDARLLRHEQDAALERALAQLDEPTRQMILLRHFGELSFAEIAETCGCPLGTALAKVHRGLKKLRSILEASDEPSGVEV